MLSCKDVVKSLSSDQELSFLKKTELKLHLMMCQHCGKYFTHLRILRDAACELMKKQANLINQAEIRKLEDDVIKKETERKNC